MPLNKNQTLKITTKKGKSVTIIKFGKKINPKKSSENNNKMQIRYSDNCSVSPTVIG